MNSKEETRSQLSRRTSESISGKADASAICTPGGAVGCGAGGELEHHAGDDAERALAADEKLLQIITHIVLAQCPHVAEQAAVRSTASMPAT